MDDFVILTRACYGNLQEMCMPHFRVSVKHAITIYLSKYGAFACTLQSNNPQTVAFLKVLWKFQYTDLNLLNLYIRRQLQDSPLLGCSLQLVKLQSRSMFYRCSHGRSVVSATLSAQTLQEFSLTVICRSRSNFTGLYHTTPQSQNINISNSACNTKLLCYISQ